MCSLYLSIMDRMGITLDRFGDADTRPAPECVVCFRDVTSGFMRFLITMCMSAF